MQIEFASSGGVANRELQYQVDTNSLSPGQAKELKNFVENAGVFELRQEELSPNVTVGRADVITYRLSLSEGSRHVSLWFNDITAPASIRPLLMRLQELAMEYKGE